MIKKLFIYIYMGFLLGLTGCGEKNDHATLHFAISAEYPPFEYQSQGQIQGFDIDLGKLIASRLGKEAVFDNMQFSSILPALITGQVDVAISTITITEERKKSVDFTTPYYFDGLAAVFHKETPIKNVAQLKGKKLASQLGTTMQIWLKKNFPNEANVAMDSNNQAIEALKAGHVDVVLMDGAQAAVFSQKNPGLAYAIITKSKDGYSLALKKGSILTAEINHVLKTLEAEGEIEKLKQKWLGASI